MDWNDDGKMDLVAGDSRGNVTLFLNTGVRGSPKLAAREPVEADGKPITASRKVYKRTGGRTVVDRTITGSHELAQIYSKIHVADWDGDGLEDLLVGHSSTVIMYKNVGTASAPRLQAPVALDSPDGRWPSRPSPYVVDWDGDGKKDLLLGSERPKVYFHRNLGTNKEPQLARGQLLDLKGPGFERGYRCRIDVTDWNNDGKLDLLVGNFCSGGGAYGGNIWLFLRK